MKYLFVILSILVLMSSCSDDDDDFIICTAEEQTGFVTEVNDTQARVETSIVINATTEQVWSVLTDFDSYTDWSSTFQGLEGDIRNGGQITALFPDGMDGIFPFPHELIYEEGRRFGWSDPIVGFSGIVDNHFYVIEACGSETNFIQTDGFTGSDPNGSAIGFANALLASYQSFNAELKAEVESRF